MKRHLLLLAITFLFIPPKASTQASKVFNLYKPTIEGTGLDLSLIYDLMVKENGEDMAVNSKEDEGSEFIITIPIS